MKLKLTSNELKRTTHLNTSSESKDNTTIRAEDKQNRHKMASENIVDEKITDQNLLKTNGFENNETNREILKALSRFGVTKNKENFTAILDLLKNIGNSKNKIFTAIFLQSKGLDADSADIIAKYFAGATKFSSLFNLLDTKSLALLKSAWIKGNFTETLLDLMSTKEEVGGLQSKIRNKLIKNFSENLIIHNLLSIQDSSQQESKVFFQYPIFWNNRETPDTLEGEASFPQDQSNDTGFALKILVSPPSLGDIELKLNQLSKQIYITIASAEEKSRQLLSTITQSIHKKLSQQGWNKITVSILPLTQGKALTIKPAPITKHAKSKIDLKV